MRYFWTRRHVPVTRILLIESGSRSLLEKLFPLLRSTWAQDVPIDLVTCFAGLPAGFPAETNVYRVTDYGSPDSRKELIRILSVKGYSHASMICSAEPIMTKWKWLIFARVPARFFILNENGDYVWVQREYWPILRHFALVRMGLAGAGAIHTIGRLLIFPFAILFLLLYAFTAHAGRLIRSGFHPSKL